MIVSVLKFLENKINEFVKIKTRLENCVVLSGFDNEIDDAKIIISLVNIEEELALSNQSHFSKESGLDVVKKAPIFLNLYILVSVVSSKTVKSYTESLKYLSLVIQFFQGNGVLLESKDKLPVGVSKLVFEIVNLSIDNMNRFWGSIGGKYRPSVIYKIKMLKIDDKSIESVITSIGKPIVNVKK